MYDEIKSPLKAIRLKCLDCVGFSAKRVADCTEPLLDPCWLRPYRFGKRPKPDLIDKHKDCYIQNPMKAIRKHCLWCCLESPYEVERCPSKGYCPLWYFRMGKNPYLKVSDKQRETAKRNIQKAILAKKGPFGGTSD